MENNTTTPTLDDALTALETLASRFHHLQRAMNVRGEAFNALQVNSQHVAATAMYTTQQNAQLHQRLYRQSITIQNMRLQIMQLSDAGACLQEKSDHYEYLHDMLVNSLDRRIDSFDAVVAGLAIARNQAVQDRDRAVDTAQAALDVAERVSAEVAALKLENNQLSAEVKVLKTDNDQLSAEVKALKADNEQQISQKAENDQLSAEVKSLKADNKRLTAEAKALKRLSQEAKAMEAAACLGQLEASKALEVVMNDRVRLSREAEAARLRESESVKAMDELNKRLNTAKDMLNRSIRKHSHANLHACTVVSRSMARALSDIVRTAICSSNAAMVSSFGQIANSCMDVISAQPVTSCGIFRVVRGVIVDDPVLASAVSAPGARLSLYNIVASEIVESLMNAWKPTPSKAIAAGKRIGETTALGYEHLDLVASVNDVVSAHNDDDC